MHTYPFKCHIHGYASLKDFSFGLLIFPDLLSYENNKEFIFKQLQPVFFFFFYYILYISEIVWCVFEISSLKKTKACIN